MDYPQVDLPVDIIAWTDVTEDILNIYKQSCKLKACIFALCLEGSSNVSINLIDTEIRQGDFIALLPGTIIQFYGPSEKVRIAFVGFSSQCVGGVNLIRSTLSSFTNLLESPVTALEPAVASYIEGFMSLLAGVTTGPYKVDKVLAQKVLDIMLYVTDMLYADRPAAEKEDKSRKKEIYRKLIQLVIENYTKERRAQFYADRLGISLQHLSTTVKQVTGKSVLDIIAYVVLVDVKAKLKSTDMTIQEISYSLNFPSPSFFGKYFKRHVGMSPLEYRNS